MVDDKDLEIARLQGQLEEARNRRGGAGVGTLKVLGTLVAVAVTLVVFMIATEPLLPDPPTPEEQAAAIIEKCRGDEACMYQEYLRTPVR